MAKPRQLHQRRGWAFSLCVGIVKPLLLAFTKRRWSGAEHLPATGGCVLVANHISHLDPLTFAHYVYDNGRLPRYLAKSEVFDIPVAGKVVRSAGQIPVYRLSTDASQAFSAAVEAVNRGECVVVYPEGTITRDPGLWPMTGKSGAARIALATGCPVIPVAQWGAHEILAPYTKKPKLFPRKTIRMRAGAPIALDDLRDGQVTPDKLRQATDRIMTALSALLGEIRGQEPPATRFDPRAAGVRQIGNPNAQPRRGRSDRRSGEAR
ncbi:MAG TPA: lysophospholipid acyltransferase family protein [Nocardioidaceae bacterium]|nr:lysophospholipid acyltransferase family protein [Nocardioidaceae bacterium]